ncbi:MAG: SDR family NAD(P)-dependent oxidoreductase [Sphingopyxis sp.]|uniref:NAD(P)-dependent dehydrogenase (Short-subunit alcohol dehydrogenase family) n=1 Tax=Sphingopyxis panaciterrulae TaxID=462372 RepID=A0A7W9B9P0_9SPHN|nr:SDR family NAD(P)-dependent oxidoreductase [Sphingopyxis panaciterrulae]MBB5708770.1 NAD(P)-dependent dehydrogenase (short-subunit alcohol dehydrogenase family) [Sphingopyxis panaciterrulae]
MSGKRALVIGSGGGIGAALVDQLVVSGRFDRVYAGSRRPEASNDPSVKRLTTDILDDDTLAEAGRQIANEGALDLLIVATGLLHRGTDIRPEKSLRQLDASVMAEVFAINSVGPALVAKHFLPLLARRQRAVAIFLSARVGSIADNRLGGWHSYRASKAALNALVRCFAIELGRSNPEAIVAALHPGTVDTPLSEPFQARVAESSLFSADKSAMHIMAVFDQLSSRDSGGFYGWDGRPIPY